jgi:flagellar hook protein FlgE
VYFSKSGTTAGQWQWSAVAEGSEISGGSAGPVVVGQGTIQFTTGGALNAENTPTTPLSVSWTGAAANQAITVDFGASIAENGTGLSGTTQFATPTDFVAQTQNGYPPGTLDNVEIDELGQLHGRYSNGQSKAFAQLAIARFAAREELQRIGGSLYLESAASGQALVSTAGASKSNVVAGSLEQSNVDLANEFVTLIAEQRAFSASSRTITTADEVFQETINLKR